MSSCRKIQTAECILQGSIYISVYHNLSLILMTDFYIFNISNAVHIFVVHVHKFTKTHKVYFQTQNVLGSEMLLYGPRHICRFRIKKLSL